MNGMLRVSLYTILCGAIIWLAKEPSSDSQHARLPTGLTSTKASDEPRQSQDHPTAFSGQSAVTNYVPAELPYDFSETQQAFNSNRESMPPDWMSQLSLGLTAQNAEIRRSVLQQAMQVHNMLVNNDTEEDELQTLNIQVQALEQRLLEGAWDETDPFALQDFYLPFLAAQPSDAAKPVLEHLLEIVIPGETLATVIEILIDNEMWSRANAWSWIKSARLEENTMIELISDLRDAFPDGAFTSPPDEDAKS